MLSKRLVVKYYPHFVAGCLIVHRGKVLLVKENAIERGKWNQPAGWVDKYENSIDCAKRETEEETGLKIKITHLLGVYNLIKRKQISRVGQEPIDSHALKLIFLAKVVDGRIKFDKKEISEVRWFELKEILKMNKKELRDWDIKNEVRDYLRGVKYPLKIITHTDYTTEYYS